MPSSLFSGGQHLTAQFYPQLSRFASLVDRIIEVKIQTMASVSPPFLKQNRQAPCSGIYEPVQPVTECLKINPQIYRLHS